MLNDNNNLPPSVFNYLSYREFMNDFYHYKKKNNDKFSFAVLSRQAGIKSRSYIKMILTNQRRLNSVYAHRIPQAMGLDKNQTNYFLSLAMWNESEDPVEKELHWNNLVKCMPKESVYRLSQVEIKIFRNWHMLALIEMARLKDFEPNLKWLAERFGNRVSPDQVYDALKILKNFGLLKEESDGKLAATNKLIYGDSEVPSEVIQLYHRSAIPVGLEVLAKVPPQLREFAGAAVAIRKEDVQKLKNDIREFHQKILEYASGITNADEVYQLNMQFFPLTNQVQKQGAERDEKAA